jgi:hypothetical protein
MNSGNRAGRLLEDLTPAPFESGHDGSRKTRRQKHALLPSRSSR